MEVAGFSTTRRLAVARGEEVVEAARRPEAARLEPAAVDVEADLTVVDRGDAVFLVQVVLGRHVRELRRVVGLEEILLERT